MKIDPKISLDDFKAEMQHRVVRYSLRSLPVQQALRFARQHKDPEYFRVASNKIHSQRQFQREMYGPGWFERVFDYLSFGSLREVVMTVLLVGLGVLGIDVGKRAMQNFFPASKPDSVEFEKLAKLLGYPLTDEGSNTGSALRSALPSARTRSVANMQSGLSDDDVQRIAKALWKEMQEKGLANEGKPVETTVGHAATEPTPNTNPLVASSAVTGSEGPPQ
ncbi:MAG: hypothetical protein WCI02_02685 [Planctomycetota bacterium]